MGHASNGTCLKWNMPKMVHFSNGACLKWDIPQMGHASNGTCLKRNMPQIGHASNGACFKWGMYQMGHVSNGTCLKWDMPQMGQALLQETHQMQPYHLWFSSNCLWHLKFYGSKHHKVICVYSFRTAPNLWALKVIYFYTNMNYYFYFHVRRMKGSIGIPSKIRSWAKHISWLY